MSTSRSRSASAFRDRNTDDLLPERLCTLSRILVWLCRHRATDHGITPARTGWLPIVQVLAQANHERQTMCRRAQGKGRGGGSAPVLADLERGYTIHEVIQIVHRARRPRLGLMETTTVSPSTSGRGTSTQAYGCGKRRRTTISSPTQSRLPCTRSCPGWR